MGSIIEAIENSALILICLSEQYYMSPHCRLEAEYAFKLNKPIIPIIIENDFVPRGWLCLIIGENVYYNFTKNSFATSLSSLIKEIDRNLDDQILKSTLKEKQISQNSICFLESPKKQSNKPTTQKQGLKILK